MNTVNQEVAVLIPYYQKEPGILAGTLAAVLDQRGFDNFHVIVVDDGSPVPARAELAALNSPTDKVSIIEQPNAGPGAARNKALEHVPAGTRYVAFLDSDDRLEQNYLADAVHALNHGYDLFFANSRRADIAGSRFDWSAASADARLDLAEHLLIDKERELYEFDGDFFDFIVRRSNIIGPSTMMYRHEIGESVRYNERIYNGQDRVFKLMLCRHVKKVVFSTRIYAQEGKGINIFDSAGWGSERSLSLLSSYLDMCRVILREIPLSDSQRTHVRRHYANVRYSFVASLLHHIKHGHAIDWRLVGKTLRSDPGTLIRFLPNAVKIAIKKARAWE